MARLSILSGRSYCIKTFGCQMNSHDSERVSGLLDSHGMFEVAEPADADIVVFMTCCVREHADTRLYGQVSNVVSLSAPPNGRRLIAIGGCIAQRDGADIRRNIPSADIVFGTQALASLPELAAQAWEGEGRALKTDVNEPYAGFSSDLPSHRAQSFHAWVPIMYGCNNFCSYCIVPYVRGRERGRLMESIVEECAKLVDDGVREICLLGQNVNSYGRDLYGEPRFAELLRKVGETGIARLRFTSSNPKDLTDDVIAAMAETPAVMPHLHLAVQSGSNAVLKAMRRSYTREEYIALTRRLRAAMPDLSLTTDVIVGFPGETEADFADTISLFEEVRFAAAYTFIFSPRPGTPAAEMVDDTPRELIQERFDRLAKLVEDLSFEANSPYLGRMVESLVEGPSKADPTVLVGHSPHNQTVLFPLPEGRSAEDYIGRMADVQVDEARTWYLRGPVVGDPR